jgi:hypothetical protein
MRHLVAEAEAVKPCRSLHADAGTVTARAATQEGRTMNVRRAVTLGLAMALVGCAASTSGTDDSARATPQQKTTPKDICDDCPVGGGGEGDPGGGDVGGGDTGGDVGGGDNGGDPGGGNGDGSGNGGVDINCVVYCNRWCDHQTTVIGQLIPPPYDSCGDYCWDYCSGDHGSEPA